jgi:two-component sensor histidine kinase/PAS domain-containing protein
VSDFLTFIGISVPEEIAVLFFALSVLGVRPERRPVRFALTGFCLAILYYLCWKLLLPVGFLIEVSAQILILIAALSVAWSIPIRYSFVATGNVFSLVVCIQTLFMAFVPLFASTTPPFSEGLLRPVLAWTEIAILAAGALAVRRLGFALMAGEAAPAKTARIQGWKMLALGTQVTLLAAILSLNANYLLNSAMHDPSRPGDALRLLGGLSMLFGAASFAVYLIIVRETVDRQNANRVLSGLISHLPGLVYRRGVDGDFPVLHAEFGVLGGSGEPAVRSLGRTGAAWLLEVEEEDRPALVRAVADAIAAGSGYEAEYRLRGPAGAEVWVLDRGEIIRNDDGTAVASEGFVEDISDRRRAERELGAARRERDKLTAELFHRTGNCMQIVSSMIRLRSSFPLGADGDGGLPYGDIAIRVEAIGIAHQMLLPGGDLSVLDFDAYVAELVGRFLGREEGRGTTAGLSLAPVKTSIDQAVSAGLLITELLLNAERYGISEDGRCALSISLEVAEPGTIRITVGDEGPGLPAGLELASLTSYGLPIANELARKQLNGTLELSEGPGLRCVLTFPSAIRQRV